MIKSFLARLVSRGLFIGGLVAFFILTQLSFVKAVNITGIYRNGDVWVVEGTIAINPQETPPKIGYNHEPDGFLSWWEHHINDVLVSQRIHTVQVRNLQLWFISVSPTKDCIGFKAELVLRAKNPAALGAHTYGWIMFNLGT